MNASTVGSMLADSLGQPRLAWNDEGACALHIRDGLVLEMQVVEDSEELRLTLPLGGTLASRRPALMLEALVSNMVLATGTDLHLAWEASSEQLVLCRTWGFDQLVADSLRAEILAFISSARSLRSQLNQTGLLDQ